MSLSNAFETLILNHLFNNAAIAGVGDVAGLPPAATAGSFYLGLHTADPGEAGTQATSEATYTGYARVAVARAAGGWAVSGNQASNTAVVNFPAATAGTNSITHVSIGTDATGPGTLMYSGALTAALAVSAGITPSFAAGALAVTAD